VRVLEGFSQPVGLVKGPGDTPLEFKFITPDKDNLKSGEFIYYLLNGRKIICRITRRHPLRLYPDLYLSKPGVPPEKIVRVLGLSNREFELFEMTAMIMGYFDTSMGFINPRIPPKPGQAVFLAEAETIQEVLMKKRAGDVGSIHIGYLLNRDEDVEVVLDASLVTSEHMCILASTGSGKSYLAGVLIEELLKPYNSGAVLILDPHGEYHTLKEVEGRSEFISDGYRPIIRIFGKDEIKIRLSELEYDELLNLLPGLTEKMEAMLSRAFRDLEGTKFTARELMELIESSAGNEAATTAQAIRWRIRRYIEEVDVIDDYEHMELKELLKPGQASVLQLTELSDMEQQILVSVLLKRILKARINAEKSQSGEKLDYPVFVVVEEAHRFASRDSRSYPVLKTILSEGRKFGVGVCLISQRPSKIDSDILSQCMTQIIMRIVNPADQDNIRSSVESIGREMIDELPGLTKGQALVAGVAINAPVLIRVRKRLTSHGGISKDAPSEWIRWRESQEAEVRPVGRTRETKLFWE
jgi:hypothetical protein